MTEQLEARSVGSMMAKALRWTLPVVVSVALMAYVFSGIDLALVMEQFTGRVASYFLPALAVFLVLTLWIEAVCIVVVVSSLQPFSDLWIAARIKAASYLLGLLNYALGVGAVTVLLRRRAGMSLADSAGAILVIGLFDLGSILLLASIGTVLLDTETAGVRVGIVVSACAAIVAGFAVLRAPISMGFFDRVRDLEVFRFARSLPIAALLKLGVLRLLFIGTFILLAQSVLLGFGVSVPPLQVIVNISILLVVAALPIAAAGLGTGQLIFVAVFQPWAESETLLAASLTLSFGLIVTRSIIGLVFAQEYTREALAANREGDS